MTERVPFENIGVDQKSPRRDPENLEEGLFGSAVSVTPRKTRLWLQHDSEHLKYAMAFWGGRKFADLQTTDLLAVAIADADGKDGAFERAITHIQDVTRELDNFGIQNDKLVLTLTLEGKSEAFNNQEFSEEFKQEVLSTYQSLAKSLTKAKAGSLGGTIRAGQTAKGMISTSEAGKKTLSTSLTESGLEFRTETRDKLERMDVKTPNHIEAYLLQQGYTLESEVYHGWKDGRDLVVVNDKFIYIGNSKEVVSASRHLNARWFLRRMLTNANEKGGITSSADFDYLLDLSTMVLCGRLHKHEALLKWYKLQNGDQDLRLEDVLTQPPVLRDEGGKVVKLSLGAEFPTKPQDRNFTNILNNQHVLHAAIRAHSRQSMADLVRVKPHLSSPKVEQNTQIVEESVPGSVIINRLQPLLVVRSWKDGDVVMPRFDIAGKVQVGDEQRSGVLVFYGGKEYFGKRPAGFLEKGSYLPSIGEKRIARGRIVRAVNELVAKKIPAELAWVAGLLYAAGKITDADLKKYHELPLILVAKDLRFKRLNARSVMLSKAIEGTRENEKLGVLPSFGLFEELMKALPKSKYGELIGEILGIVEDQQRRRVVSAPNPRGQNPTVVFQAAGTD